MNSYSRQSYSDSFVKHYSGRALSSNWVTFGSAFKITCRNSIVSCQIEITIIEAVQTLFQNQTQGMEEDVKDIVVIN